MEKPQETYGVQLPSFSEHLTSFFCDQLLVSPERSEVRESRVNSSFSWKVEDSYSYTMWQPVKWSLNRGLVLFKWTFHLVWTSSLCMGLSPIYGTCPPENEWTWDCQSSTTKLWGKPRYLSDKATTFSTDLPVLPWFHRGRWAIWGAPAVTSASRRRTIVQHAIDNWYAGMLHEIY